MGLDKEIADKRADLILHGSIQYSFNLILETDKFSGLAELVFVLKQKPIEHLPLCFSG